MNEELIARKWDVIVVGTGMGGATLGHALAKAGMRVLFIERGKSSSQASAMKGRYPEEQASASPGGLDRKEIFSRAGREWTAISDRSQRKPRTLIPLVGAGTGGSSALYGMALERFFPDDFSPRSRHSAAVDADLPQSWPVSYETMRPFYAEAERLYRVRGERDVLRGSDFDPPYLSAPPLSEGARRIREHLVTQGLHPYRLPQACEFKPDCTSCQGYLCPRECKNDSSRICLEPAIKDHGAALLDECEVLRLEASAAQVTGVVCRRGERTFEISSSTVILAAGALNTPRILLSSRSAQWPDGLANRSGLVGKYLMRHFIDLYVLSLPAEAQFDTRWKELAFNDLYVGSPKLGTVQSFGSLPPAEQLVETVHDELRESGFPLAHTLFRAVKPSVKAYMKSLLERGFILASIMEDLPYKENQLALDESGSGVRLAYRVREYDAARIAEMRRRLRSLLRPYRPKLLKQAENNDRLAHACGTCRFGDEPATSVLNAQNRAHDVKNLYVVDASFFPSSGGINPALTIAANALRVAREITEEQGSHAQG